MPRHELLGPWVRRFLLEHIVGERNLSGFGCVNRQVNPTPRDSSTLRDLRRVMRSSFGTRVEADRVPASGAAKEGKCAGILGGCIV